MGATSEEEGEFDEPIAKARKRKEKGGSEKGKGSGKKARIESDGNGFATYSADFESMMGDILEDVKVREKAPLAEHGSSKKKKEKTGGKRN